MMKWEHNPKYRQIGITAFLVIAASMLFYFLIFRMSTLGKGLAKIISVLNPIIYGYVIAYILNPQASFIEGQIYKLIHRTKRTPSGKTKSAIRLFSVLAALGIAILLIYALISVILPELIRSVRSVVFNVQNYANTINNYIDNTFQNHTELDATTTSLISEYADKIQVWFLKEINPMIDSLSKNVSTQLVSLVTFFKNIFLGMVISIYILTAKENQKARVKRMLYSLVPIKTANRILINLRFIDEKFGGFIIGKVIDSLIIGIITYFACNIMRMPYAVLISVVIGVTNIIPFFGPFLGAIPSAFLIFVTNPIKALIFILFIIILQQFDGNLLGPRILGNSVGISSYVVVLAILIGGGFFGITGMVIGVPCAAVLVALIQGRILRRMKEKGLPGDLESYHYAREINPETKAIITNDNDGVIRGIYDRIRRRDDIVTSYDEPLKEHSWDMTMEQIEAEENLINGIFGGQSAGGQNEAGKERE